MHRLVLVPVRIDDCTIYNESNFEEEKKFPRIFPLQPLNISRDKPTGTGHKRGYTTLF